MNKIIIYLSFLSIFTSFPSKACVQEEDIEGLYESLAPQDRSLSPVNGLIVLRSGQLWKARFDGRFGEYKPEYLCHYSILNPTRHAPRANVDSPHDCTSSIIQQIFPSPAGGRLSIPGNHGDMFRLMPIGEIGRLLMAYVRVKNGADAVVLDELFSSYFVPQQGQAKKAEGWAIKRSNRKEMEKLWTKEVFAVLPKRYASMFAGAIKETSRYPDCFVESTLLALAVAKAQSVSDLQPLLEEIGYPDAGKNSTHRFNKSFYESWLGRLSSKERRDIELLLRDPEALIYLTLAQDKYGSAFPKSLGAGTAVHTYLDENGVERKESFSDCGESSARAFWDKVVANLATRTFDTKFLEAAFPNLSRNFIYFYNGNPHKSGGFAQLKFEDINDGEEGRSAWADVMSSLNTPDDKTPIIYRAKGRCNIKGVGVDNMLNALEKILGTKLIHQDMEFADEKVRRAYAMNQLFSKISRDGHVLSWYVKKGDDEVTDRLDKFESLIIRLNGEDNFTWLMNHDHFQFSNINENNHNDWRAARMMGSNHVAIIPELIKYVPRHLVGLLMPYFQQGISLSDDMGQMDAIIKQGFGFDTVFSFGSDGSEDKLKKLEILLKISPEIALDIAPYWISRVALEDNTIGSAALSLLYTYRHQLMGPVINENSHPRLYRFFMERSSALKAYRDFKDLVPIVRSPYGAALLQDLLKDADPEEIATVMIQDEDSDDELDQSSDEEGADVNPPVVMDFRRLDYPESVNFLVLACQLSRDRDHGCIDAVKILMEKAGDYFFGDKLPEHLHTLAVYVGVYYTGGSTEIGLTILKHPKAREFFFPTEGDHPRTLDSIRWICNDPMSFLYCLLIPELREHLLKPEIFNPSSVESVKKYRGPRVIEDKLDNEIENDLTRYSVYSMLNHGHYCRNLMFLAQFPEVIKLLFPQEEVAIVARYIEIAPDYFNRVFLNSNVLGGYGFSHEIRQKYDSLSRDDKDRVLMLVARCLSEVVFDLGDHHLFIKELLKCPPEDMEKHAEKLTRLLHLIHFVPSDFRFCLDSMNAFPIMLDYFLACPDLLCKFLDKCHEDRHFPMVRHVRGDQGSQEPVTDQHKLLAIRLVAGLEQSSTMEWYYLADMVDLLCRVPFDRVETVFDVAKACCFEFVDVAPHYLTTFFAKILTVLNEVPNDRLELVLKGLKIIVGDKKMADYSFTNLLESLGRINLPSHLFLNVLEIMPKIFALSGSFVQDITDYINSFSNLSNEHDLTHLNIIAETCYSIKKSSVLYSLRDPDLEILIKEMVDVSPRKLPLVMGCFNKILIAMGQNALYTRGVYMSSCEKLSTLNGLIHWLSAVDDDKIELSTQRIIEFINKKGSDSGMYYLVRFIEKM